MAAALTRVIRYRGAERLSGRRRLWEAPAPDIATRAEHEPLPMLELLPHLRGTANGLDLPRRTGSGVRIDFSLSSIESKTRGGEIVARATYTRTLWVPPSGQVQNHGQALKDPGSD